MARKIERKRRDYSKLHGSKLKDSFDKDGKPSYQDERFWVVSKDDSGNGSAVIRFLPNKNEEDLPFKITYKHSIFVNGKRFIDRCPTTLGKDCPICDWNKDQDSEIVKKELKSYRKKHWISNILVISDPKNRENEGKVFLFEFGKQIFDIIKETLQPEDEDDEPLYYYCPTEGANFKIKIKKEAEYSTWARSSFADPSSIDPVLENFNMTDEDWMSQLYDLDEIISEQAYKEYDDLKVKFVKFMGLIKVDGIRENAEFEKSEENSAQSFTRTKREAQKIIDEDEKVADEEPEDNSKSATSKKDISLSKRKKVNNFFNKFENEDDDD